jgi:hypothetical protein
MEEVWSWSADDGKLCADRIVHSRQQHLVPHVNRQVNRNGERQPDSQDVRRARTPPVRKE